MTSCRISRMGRGTVEALHGLIQRQKKVKINSFVTDLCLPAEVKP